MDEINIGFLSYLLGALAFSALSVLIFLSWRGRELGARLLFATTSMAIWAAVLAIQSLTHAKPSVLVWTLEILRDTIWFIFLQKLMEPAIGSKTPRNSSIDLLRFVSFSVVILLLLFEWTLPLIQLATRDFVTAEFRFVAYVVLALIGMFSVEQLYRNARLDQRWAIKFVCLAVGGLFAYDFYLYSDALFFREMDPNLWNARGAVLVICVPLIALSVGRNPNWSVELFISRGIIFHSATLVGASIYLFVMLLTGHYIKYYGGSWGAVAQIVFLFGAFMVLLALLFSGQIRSWLRVFLSKHFFSYAYDYRQEWLGVIARLSQADPGIPLQQRVILVLARLVESPGGVLWINNRHNQLVKRTEFGNPGIYVDKIDGNDPLIEFIVRTKYLIHLDEMRQVPEIYQGLERPQWLESYRNAWAIVPLFQGNSLYGLVLLTTPNTSVDWNWEVIDVLRTTAVQATSYLALEEAALALSEARQFEGFNRLSAFVIHDLKNVIAQLTLVTQNAQRHKDNPAFMIDAIKTVNHSVEKMNRLLSQLRNTESTGTQDKLSIKDILSSTVHARSRQSPVPNIEILDASDPIIAADRDRLFAAFEHIIQNAQEAAGRNGVVGVTLQSNAAQAIVEVRDNGPGMDEEFIAERLFKPFDTTKGLTGMGIGAFESREYVRSLGGDLVVISRLGVGTTFRYRFSLSNEKKPDFASCMGDLP